ncbi:substrate-binding periplasmic protein [Halopseudomonas sp.]|uniref:substrate-binding periplasmic protein n=1 Tax=Halopseudomonas sp. TaxID=2901191 RepID=UPI00356941F1
MHLLRLLVIFLLLASCSAMGSHGNNSANAPVFLIAEVWPWGYLDENNQPAGLITEFASRLSSRAGIEMHYRVLPHQRVLANFRGHDGDYTMLFQNPVVDSFAERVGLAQISDILLITPRDSRQKLTLAGLSGKRLGYIGGTYYGEAFSADRGIIKLPLSSLDQAIRMLELGRLDALITSDILLHHTLRQMQLDPQAFRSRVLTRGHVAYLYASRDNTTAIHLPAIQAALEEMRDSGELDSIFRNALQLPPLVTD